MSNYTQEQHIQQNRDSVVYVIKQQQAQLATATKALQAIADIKTHDCNRYVDIADSIAIEALIKLEE